MPLPVWATATAVDNDRTAKKVRDFIDRFLKDEPKGRRAFREGPSPQRAPSPTLTSTGDIGVT